MWTAVQIMKFSFNNIEENVKRKKYNQIFIQIYGVESGSKVEPDLTVCRRLMVYKIIYNYCYFNVFKGALIRKNVK